jgi:pseudouridine-5'-phosphate glycosidase
MQRFLLILLLMTGLIVNGSIVHAEDEPAPVLSDIGTYSTDARAARISALRGIYKIKLDDQEKALVSSRCVEAQAGLKKISSKLVGIKTAREKTYATTISTLIQLKSLIADKGIDTSGMDLLIVSYQQKKAVFDSSFTAYELTLEDAVAIDCMRAPEDFRAALEGVRTARKPVVEVSGQITELTRSNLKTTFDSIRLRLQTIGVSNG